MTRQCLFATGQAGFMLPAAIVFVGTIGAVAAGLWISIDKAADKVALDRGGAATTRIADSAAAVVQSFYRLPAGQPPIAYPRPYIAANGGIGPSAIYQPPEPMAPWRSDPTSPGGGDILVSVPSVSLQNLQVFPDAMRTIGAVPVTTTPARIRVLQFLRDNPALPFLVTKAEVSVEAAVSVRRNGKQITEKRETMRYRVPVEAPPPPTCTLSPAGGTRQVPINSVQTVIMNASGIIVDAQFIDGGTVLAIPRNGPVPFPAQSSLESPSARLATRNVAVGTGPLEVRARVIGADGRAGECSLSFNDPTVAPICSIVRTTPQTIIQGQPVSVALTRTGGGPVISGDIATSGTFAPAFGVVFPAGTLTNSFTFPPGALLAATPFAVARYDIFGRLRGPGGLATCAGSPQNVVVAPPSICRVTMSLASIVAGEPMPVSDATLTVVSGVITDGAIAWPFGRQSGTFTRAFAGTNPGLNIPGTIGISGEVYGPYQNATCATSLRILPAPPRCNVALGPTDLLDPDNAGSATNATIAVTNSLSSQPSGYQILNGATWQNSQSTMISGTSLQAYGDFWIAEGRVLGTSGAWATCQPAVVRLLPRCHATLTGANPIVRGDPNSCVDAWLVTDQGTPLAKAIQDSTGAWTPPLPLTDPRKRYCGNDFNNIGPTTLFVAGAQRGPYGTKQCAATAFSVVNPPPPTCWMEHWPNNRISNKDPGSWRTVVYRYAGIGVTGTWAKNSCGGEGAFADGSRVDYNGSWMCGGSNEAFISASVTGYGGTGTCQGLWKDPCYTWETFGAVREETYSSFSIRRRSYPGSCSNHKHCSVCNPWLAGGWWPSGGCLATDGGWGAGRFRGEPYAHPFARHDTSEWYGWGIDAAMGCFERGSDPVNPVGCFDAETQILMGDGKTTQRVKELRVGDLVWNPARGHAARIARTRSGPELAPLVTVTVGERRVVVTGKHPLPTSHGLVAADGLREGEWLTLAGGERGQITKIERSESPSKPDAAPLVFNISLEAVGLDPRDHMVVAGGIVTGDLDLQEAMEEDRGGWLDERARVAVP